jgi:hypothetical protein
MISRLSKKWTVVKPAEVVLQPISAGTPAPELASIFANVIEMRTRHHNRTIPEVLKPQWWERYRKELYNFINATSTFEQKCAISRLSTYALNIGLPREEK